MKTLAIIVNCFLVVSAMWEAEALKIGEEKSLERAPSAIEGAVAPTAAPAKERITSVFHGNRETDYKGKSWIDKPQGWKERDEDLQDYLPKR